mgnify:CR=1 FL=1
MGTTTNRGAVQIFLPWLYTNKIQKNKKNQQVKARVKKGQGNGAKVVLAASVEIPWDEPYEKLDEIDRY